MLFGGIITALVTKSVKPIYIIAIASSVGACIVIVGAIATLFKEIKSSETQASIKNTGDLTNVEVKVLREKNDSLLSQSETQGNLLISQSRQLESQSKQLASQNEQLTSQGERIVSQEKTIKDLNERDQEATAKAQAAEADQFANDKKSLRRTLSMMFILVVKNRDWPIQNRTFNHNREWINLALPLFQSEADNTFLKQYKPEYEKWTDTIASLRSASQFLSDPSPRYRLNRDNYHDEETSRKMFNESMYTISRNVFDAMHAAEDIPK